MLKGETPKKKNTISLILLPWAIWIFLALDLLFFGWLFYRGTFSRSKVESVTAQEQSAITPAKSAGGTNLEETALNSPQDVRLDLIKAGNASLAAGANEEAIVKFTKAIQLNAEDEDAHFNLGIALTRTGKPLEAKKHYEKALEIVPDYEEVHNNLGNLLLVEGKTDEAIVHFLKVISSNPDNSNGHNNYGTALARVGKIPEAILSFSKAISLQNNHFDARVNLANAYLSQKRSEEALQELGVVLKMNPNFPPALKALARAKQKLSR